MADPTQRFSDRVEDYVRYRPGYPPEILGTLRRECGLTAATVVADIGSGTGILARLFLGNGNRVIMVEPNDAMRRQGERLHPGPGSPETLAGTAEATLLPPESVDMITAGQAFHWFRPDAARAEFGRVLRPGGMVVLVWNKRRKSGTPFLAAYEALLGAYGTDYTEVEHPKTSDPRSIRAFFAPDPVRTASFENRQILDREGLRGRLRSSSYTPAEGQPGHEEMLRELDRVFREHETEGHVSMEYETQVFFGPLSSP